MAPTMCVRLNWSEYHRGLGTITTQRVRRNRGLRYAKVSTGVLYTKRCWGAERTPGGRLVGPLGLVSTHCP